MAEPQLGLKISATMIRTSSGFTEKNMPRTREEMDKPKEKTMTLTMMNLLSGSS
jgi:hypothetical protein